MPAIGQWPWPRTTVARLVDQLAAQGAAVVAFDILFAEPDQTSPEQFLEHLPPEEAERLKPLFAGQPSHDAVLADAIGRSPTVLAAALTGRPSEVPLQVKAGFAVAGDDPLPFLGSFAGSSQNLLILDEKASGIGAINWIPDRDQVVRRISIVFGMGDQFVPALFAEALRVAQGASTYILKASNASGEEAFGRQTGLNNIKWGAIETPTDSDGAIWLQFRPSNPSAFVPAWKVLAGENDPNEVAGMIMLVGTSAPGLNDLRATPLDAALPGVEIHAQAIEHVLSGRSLSRPDYAPAIEILLVVLVGAALGAVLPRISAGAAALLGASIMVAIFVGGWLAYNNLHLLLDPSYPALAIGLLVALATLYVYRRVEQQRGQVRLAFSHYVAPAVVDELIAHPERLELGGEVRELTILFCDVRNFTSISEQLTADELTQFINNLLTPLTDIILKRRGTIDKYMGDAIMAFWNAPLDDPAHASNACAAALEISKRMRDLNVAWQQEAAEKGRKYVPVAHRRRHQFRRLLRRQSRLVAALRLFGDRRRRQRCVPARGAFQAIWRHHRRRQVDGGAGRRSALRARPDQGQGPHGAKPPLHHDGGARRHRGGRREACAASRRDACRVSRPCVGAGRGVDRRMPGDRHRHARQALRHVPVPDRSLARKPPAGGLGRLIHGHREIAETGA